MKLTDAIDTMGEVVIYIPSHISMSTAEIGTIRGLTNRFILVEFNNARGLAKAVSAHDLLFYERPIIPQLIEWVKEENGTIDVG